MQYTIFEDNEKDDIQRLLKASYTDTSNIVWANGASNITYEIKRLGKENEYYVFMDLVPDNIETYLSYCKIKSSVKNGYRVIIFPIPCIEYYLIKMLLNIGILEDSKALRDLIDRKDYAKLAYIKDERDRRYIKTFERLCKVVIARVDKECARKSNESDRINDSLKGTLYRHDCPCKYNKCMNMTLINKSFELLLQFPCIPAGSIHSNTKKLSWEDCIVIHRSLVDEYNRDVENYREHSKEKSVENKKYKYVSYMY